VLALLVFSVPHPSEVRAAASGHYALVENWVHFPPDVTKWGMATGVDVDAHDNVYVFHRNELMPIMAFDRHGNFLRAWGRGVAKTTHFLRVDRFGFVWIADRGDMQAFKFDSNGKLLMTLGKKASPATTRRRMLQWHGRSRGGQQRRSSSPTAKAPTRVAKFAKDGRFIKWWAARIGARTVRHAPQHRDRWQGPRLRGRSFEQPDSDLRPGWPVPESVDQLRHAVGHTVMGDFIYVVDGTERNCLFIASIKDGKVLETIEGLSN
jgi:hypothetical protein